MARGDIGIKRVVKKLNLPSVYYVSGTSCTPFNLIPAKIERNFRRWELLFSFSIGDIELQ